MTVDTEMRPVETSRSLKNLKNQNNSKKTQLIIIFICVALLLTFFISLSSGSVSLTFTEIYQAQTSRGRN